jgi:hypothetical protein
MSLRHAEKNVKFKNLVIQQPQHSSMIVHVHPPAYPLYSVCQVIDSSFTLNVYASMPPSIHEMSVTFGSLENSPLDT